MTDLTASNAASLGVTAQAEKPETEGKRLGVWMAMPTQLLLLFITVFPLLMQLYISMTDWSPLDGENWVFAYRSWNDFANFIDLWSDRNLWQSIWRTLLVTAVCVPVEFLLGLGLALLFVDEFPGKRVFYPILITPMMVVPAIAGYMFFMLFQSAGPINGLLGTLIGTDVRIAWLGDPTLALVSVMIADIWQWTPLMFLILLAGLVGVPEDQVKAATILGASWFYRFRTIVLPRMVTVMVIALAIRVVEIIKIFDTLYIMTAGGPGTSTETLSVYISKVALFRLEWSYVASIALFILIILSAVAIFALSRMRKR
ncbi:carbohydrate ABC transporter permease [Mesorhizobium sp. IMUNJ 23232]|uniref:carbohydrate ABC transporter permease n=1 Tax=Mesorhizobium sp. IMUNJ 23232 TaxID=3376064 RepID=UPI0037AF3D32